MLEPGAGRRLPPASAVAQQPAKEKVKQQRIPRKQSRGRRINREKAPALQ